ncbi:sigma-70 family RNA polymerase sigma factor [Engelhardtia mirabilis]
MAQPDFERLLEQRTWLGELCRGLVGGADGEALADDTLTTAWQRPPNSRGPLRPWLATVARRLAASRRRAEGRRSRREQAAARAERTGDLTAEASERAELAERVAAQVRALPEPYRSVVLLRYFEDLSPKQIGARLDRPAGTVRSQLARGLEQLRERLDAADPRGRGGWFPLALALADRPTPLPPLAPSTAALGGLAAMKTAAAVIALASVAVLAYVTVRPDPAAGPAAAEPQAEVGTAARLHEPSPIAADGLTAEPLASAGRRDVLPESLAAPAADVEIAASENTSTVFVRAVDASGVGLPGATLVETKDNGEPQGSATLGEADGSIALELALSGERRVAQLVLTAPGRERARIETLIRAGEEHRLGAVTLALGGWVAGRVQLERGGEVRGGRAILAPVASGDPLLASGKIPDQRTWRGRADVGADGSFRIDQIGPGWWRVWAKAEGCEWTASEVFEIVEGGGRGDLRLTLTARDDSHRIAGRVVGPDGAPVPSAKLSVRCQTPNYVTESTQSAGPDGRFELTLREQVPHDLGFVDPEGLLAPVFMEQVAPGTVDLVVRLVAPEPLVLEVSGRNEPLAAYSYEIRDAASMNRLIVGSVDEDTPRPVTLSLPTRRFVIEIEAAGYVVESHGSFEPQDLHGRLPLVLTPAARISGRVLAEGRPVAGATVLLAPLVSERRLLMSNGFRTRYRTSDSKHSITDVDGNFDLPLQREGEQVFVVTAAGFAQTEVGPYDFAHGRDVDDLVLEPQRSGRIEGRVLLPAGADGEGLILGLNSGDGSPRTLRAGPGGRYEIEDLAPGWWQLQLREEEILPNRSVVAMAELDEPIPYEGDLWVRPGETTVYDVDLRDRGPCLVSGQLTGADFSGWSASLGTSTAWFGEAFEQENTGLSADGGFELQVPFDGPYTLTLTAPGGTDSLVVTEMLELEAGDTDWELDLPLGAIEGVGSAALHEGTRKVRAKWSSPTSGAKASIPIVADADGSFRLARVPAGSVSIEELEVGVGDARWRSLQRVELGAGETLRVDLP